MVLGWLTKLTLALSVLGLITLDGFAWTSARVTAQDHAERAGRAAVAAYAPTASIQSAYDAAVAEVAASGDRIDAHTFRASPEGAVTLTLSHDASTLVLHRIAALRHLTQLHATVTTSPSP